MFLHMSVILFTGGCYPSMPCRWHPSMPCRSPGGSPEPHPGGKLRGLGESPGPHPGGYPGPHLGGVYPSMHWGRPPWWTATAVGGTHPTGVHSCLLCLFTFWCRSNAIFHISSISTIITRWIWKLLCLSHFELRKKLNYENQVAVKIFTSTF